MQYDISGCGHTSKDDYLMVKGKKPFDITFSFLTYKIAH